MSGCGGDGKRLSADCSVFLEKGVLLVLYGAFGDFEGIMVRFVVDIGGN